MTITRPRRCPICEAPGPVAVAPPRLGAMLSDGAPCGVSVRRLHCRSCGLGWLPTFEAARLPQRTFGDAYCLGAAPPTAADLLRAGGYAQRIAALWDKAPPDTVLDIGCGNGALMAALGKLWPAARLRGVEPAPRVAAAARLGGNPVSRSLRPGMRASLVVSVNVVEHTPDPLAFLRSLRRAVAPGGAAILICPDGSIPWLELLMADHRWSLTPAALVVLVAQAGFAVERADPAPGGFQALALRPMAGRRAPRQRGFTSPRPRRGYLGAWRALDGVLAARSAKGRRLVCFGVGEVTRLLRVQAPRSWARIAALTADDAAGAAQLGRPFIAPAELRDGEDEVLLAVRPSAQPAVAARLGGPHAVLRWDDILAR